MNKKGFTLIELLAIISLIAIIGLITIPIANTIIAKSEIKSIKQTAIGIINASKIYNADNNYSVVNEEGIDLKDSKIQFENKENIISGKVIYNKDRELYTLINLNIYNYCVNGDISNLDIKKGDC